MPTTDATMEIFALLRANWDNTQVTDRNGTQVLADDTPVSISTGYYDRDGPMPQVAIHAKDEGPTGGGQTGLYGTDVTGLGMQLVSGALNIEFVAGSRAECEGIGPSGSSPNPKKVREAMYQHGAQFLLDNQVETNLRTLVPGDARELEDTDAGPTVFRIQQRARYVYERTPTPTA